MKGVAFEKFTNCIDIDLFVFGSFGNLSFVHNYTQ